MSIHIRVYPQYGSVGYSRSNRRRAAAQSLNFQRTLQLQSLRLQNQLATQQQMYAPSTVGGYASPFGVSQVGYNTGIAGGLGGFGMYGRNAYGAPLAAYPATGCAPQVGQYNGVSQYGGYGTVENTNSYQYAGMPAGMYGGQYGAGLIGGIGNMFANAFRGW